MAETVSSRAEPARSTVLVIDDDEDLRNSVGRLLRSVGLNARLFPSHSAPRVGNGGAGEFRRHRVVRENGDGCADALRQRRPPRQRRVYACGRGGGLGGRYRRVEPFRGGR